MRLCTRQTCLAHWNNSQQIDMLPPHLGHIILISSQPVFALSPQCCVLSGEATNTKFIVFGLTCPRLEPTIYHEHANHYDTDAVYNQLGIISKFPSQHFWTKFTVVLWVGSFQPFSYSKLCNQSLPGITNKVMIFFIPATGRCTRYIFRL